MHYRVSVLGRDGFRLPGEFWEKKTDCVEHVRLFYPQHVRLSFCLCGNIDSVDVAH